MGWSSVFSQELVAQAPDKVPVAGISVTLTQYDRPRSSLLLVTSV